MTDLLNYLVQGTLLGVAYGLIALPIGLTYATVKVADAAVGSYAMVAGITALTVGGIVGVLIGLLSGTAMALGVGLIYRGLVRRGVGDPIIVVSATFAVALAVESVVLAAHGKDPVIRSFFSSSWRVGAVYVNPQSAINLVVGVGVVAALYVCLYRTTFGMQIRGGSDNIVGALLAGIPVIRHQYVIFATSGLLASIAGVLLAWTIGLDYTSGTSLTIIGLGAAIIFGLRGPASCFLGGIVFGIIEALVGGYTSGGILAVIPAVFVLAVLVSSPQAQAVGRP